MKFREFGQYLEEIEGVSSRLALTAQLAKLFQNLELEEVPPACYLLQGQLLPSFAGLEFQIAVKTVIKALSHFSSEVDALYKKLGDLGLVAAEVMNKHTTSELTITEVYDQLLQLAKESGAESQQRKLTQFTELLEKLDPVSAKVVVRVVLGRLRLGFSDMTIMDSLSWAMTGGKSEREMLEAAYQRQADVGQLAKTYLAEKDSEKRLQRIAKDYHVRLGTPVIPALCQRLNTAAEMIEKMGEVLAEPKYDGLRVQIHFERKTDGKFTVRTFTRSLEENSQTFPELQQLENLLTCQSCILDAEAVGFDPKSGDLLPFQQTVQRKRKHGVAEKAQETPVRFFVFDLLYLNGEETIHKPFFERKEQLKKLFTDNSVLVHSPGLRTTDPVALHEYHEQALADGLEGVVVKQWDGVYQSGRKNWSWVKMKEAEGTKGKLTDTIDAIVMGYYMGRGKRAGFGIGAFLVGIRDEKNDQVLTIAKVGTGLSDEVLRQIKERCDKLAVPTKPELYQVAKALVPDIWCSPDFVVEVAADELTTSPLHTAGQALRFPRFLQYRDDKSWQDATTLVELQQIQVK